MSDVLAQALAGTAYAATLFLIASGLTLIFGVTRVVNFAHGSLYMLGAYLAYTLTAHLPATVPGFFAGVLLAALIVAAIGVAVEVIVLRRIYHAPEMFQLLATFGIVLIVADVTLWIWGPEELLAPRAPGFKGAVMLGATQVPQYTLLLLAIGPLTAFALLWLMRRTFFGLAVRAAAQDGDIAAALGIDRARLFTSVFALGAFLAGLAGALQIPRESVNLQMDLAVIVEAFVVVVVGGLGSIAGAALASLLIGLLHAFGVWWIPKSSLVLAFVVMALVLIVRPQGILGGGRAATAALAPRAVSGNDFRALTATLFVPAERRLTILAIVVLIALVTAPLWTGDYLLAILSETLILAVYAASLQLIMGSGGVTSFGHAAFFGVGAYAAALLARTEFGSSHGNFVLSLAGGPLVAGAVAFAAGWLVLRARGVYAAMLTLALAQILWSLATQWGGVTGGDNGVLGVWPPSLLSGRPAYYLFVLALAVASLWLLRRISLARFGFALRAARDAPARADASGLDTRRVQWLAFSIAGAFAGLAGALHAFYQGSVFPSVLAIAQSLDALVMVLLGGVNALAGPIVGAVAYHGLLVELTRLTNHWRLLLGVAIVLLALAFPQGLAGMLRTRVAWGRA